MGLVSELSLCRLHFLIYSFLPAGVPVSPSEEGKKINNVEASQKEHRAQVGLRDDLPVPELLASRPLTLEEKPHSTIRKPKDL